MQICSTAKDKREVGMGNEGVWWEHMHAVKEAISHASIASVEDVGIRTQVFCICFVFELF